MLVGSCCRAMRQDADRWLSVRPPMRDEASWRFETGAMPQLTREEKQMPPEERTPRRMLTTRISQRGAGHE